MSDLPYRGRIAPSPTGLLHLGHAKTFWTAFERCKAADGTLIYRDEDIDLQRCKPAFSVAAQEDLSRLGIQWTEGPILQSKRIPFYKQTLIALIEKDLVYPCHVSRKQIREHPDTQTAPNGETIFPTELRRSDQTKAADVDFSTNWRFKVTRNQLITFEDLHLGTQTFRSQIDFGDFLVWRKEGVPSYELAVVADDIDMNITEIVRGADLLVSSARQLLLYEAFSIKPPAFYHEGLVCDESGVRLAKQHNSLALRTLFAQGHDLQSLKSLWLKNS